MQDDTALSRTEYTYGEDGVLLGEKYMDLQGNSFAIDYHHQKYGTVIPENYEISYSYPEIYEISYSYDEKGRLIEETEIFDSYSNTQTWEYEDSDLPVSFERSSSNAVIRFSRETMKTEEFSKNAVSAQSQGSYIEWMEADAQTELAYRGVISEDDSQYLCSTTHSVWVEDLLGQVFWTPPSAVPEDAFATEAEWLLQSLKLQDAHALCAQDCPAIAKLCVLFGAESSGVCHRPGGKRRTGDLLSDAV